MKKKLTIIAFIIGVLILSYFLFEPVFTYYVGRTKTPNLDEVHLKKIHSETLKNKADEILEKEFKLLETPSISIAVGMNDSLIWSNSIGYADVEKKLLAHSKTKYRVGSISKSLTSVGLGLLFESKILEPNSIVENYVPYANSEISKLTIKELASHTSGIRNYSSCLCFPIWEFYDNNQYNSIKESVSIFNNDELLFEPGTDFNYSTYNYTLLSGVIEGSSNLEYLEFMKTNVFEPLELTETIPDNAVNKANNIAEFYAIADNKINKTYKTNSSNKWAGGGFLSTPINLVKFGNGVLNQKLIDSTTTKLLFEPVKLKNGNTNKQNYGLGWRNDIRKDVFKDNRKTRIIHHGGTALGSIAMLILLPEYNTSIAVAMNRSGSSSELFDITFKVAELFIAEEITTTNKVYKK